MDPYCEEPQVLIVDDIEGTRDVLRGMLNDMGFRSIVEAEDGEQALELLKRHRAQLILCDYMMDGVSGLDLLVRLRNHPYLVDIPFIMISSITEVPIVEAAMNLGAADYIVKPLSFSLLKRKISDVLRRRI